MSNAHPPAAAEALHDEPMPEGAEAAPPGTRVMAIVRWGLVGIMAAVAAASVASHLGAFDRHDGAAASAKQYTCPMHPGIVQDHPGDCPICNMTLVERAPAAPHPPGPHPVPGLAPIELTPDRVQLIGMRTAQVERRRLAGELRTVGVVAANEQGLAQIQARFSGWIEELPVDQTGQKVARGQVVAVIYSPDVLAAQQEYLSALRWSGADAQPSDPTSGLAAAARRRLELLGISGRELDELARTGQPRRALPIRSPVAGHVTRKDVVQGGYVQPGAALFEVTDLSRVWVLADVYEHELARVKPGQAARLTVAAYPGESFTGKVTFLSPTVDPSTRTLRVRLELANQDLRLRPGMYGDVHLAIDAAEGLVIPSEALVDVGTAQYVFVALPAGRFEPRAVTLGARAGDHVQVLAGVHEGETVVTTGNFLLDSESRLAASFQNAAGAAPAGGGHGGANH